MTLCFEGQVGLSSMSDVQSVATAKIIPELHITAPPITEAVQALIDRLRQEIENEEPYQDASVRNWCTDVNLYRFLRARANEVPQAKKMLLEALQWRKAYRPELITASEVERFATFGLG